MVAVMVAVGVVIPPVLGHIQCDDAVSLDAF